MAQLGRLGRGFSAGAQHEDAFEGVHKDYTGPGSQHSTKTGPKMPVTSSQAGAGSRKTAIDSFTKQRGARGDLHQ